MPPLLAIQAFRLELVFQLSFSNNSFTRTSFFSHECMCVYVCTYPSLAQFTCNGTSLTAIALADAAFLAGKGDGRQIPYTAPYLAVDESVHCP